MNVAEIEQLWRARSDDEVLIALAEIDTYEPEAQEIIVAEAERRPAVRAAVTERECVNAPDLADQSIPGPYVLVGRQSSRPLFLYIPIARLVGLSLATLGVYQFYWIYKNWQYVAERDKLQITPFWLGWFGIFWLGPLLRRIHEDSSARLVATPGFSPAIIWLWVPLVLFGSGLARSSWQDDNGWPFPLSGALVLAILQTVCLVGPQEYVNRVTLLRNPSAPYHPWSLGHFACFVPAAAWLVVGFLEGLASTRG